MSSKGICVSFAEKLAEIKARIEAACRRSGRNPREVRLLAVSKTQPDVSIEAAYACGVRDFGENYVQDLARRREKLSRLAGIRWHLIGPLQSNKAKLALQNAYAFHALDSEKLARELAKRSATLGLAHAWPVFVQVNVDDETTKSGVAPGDVAKFLDALRTIPELTVEGLMCIPKPGKRPEDSRPAFRALASLTRGLGAPRALQLSMGMSEDFEVAVEEGAHWVRVGRALFGGR